MEQKRWSRVTWNLYTDRRQSSQTPPPSSHLHSTLRSELWAQDVSIKPSSRPSRQCDACLCIQTWNLDSCSPFLVHMEMCQSWNFLKNSNSQGGRRCESHLWFSIWDAEAEELLWVWSQLELQSETLWGKIKRATSPPLISGFHFLRSLK